jgi:hypothetical protein
MTSDGGRQPDESWVFSGEIIQQTFAVTDLGFEILLYVRIQYVVRAPDSSREEGGEAPGSHCQVSFSLCADQSECSLLETRTSLEALGLGWSDLERFHPDHPDHLDLTGADVFLRRNSEGYQRLTFAPLRDALSLEEMRTVIRDLGEQFA